MAGFFDGSAPDHDHLRDIRGDDQRGADQHGNDYGRSEGLRMHLIPPLDGRNDAGILSWCRVFADAHLCCGPVRAATALSEHLLCPFDVPL